MKKPLPFGKFLLLDRINVGGMAEVFLAKAFGVEGFQRVLAIKKIIPTMVEDEEFITMFIDEARIAVQLNHANIVQIHELGKFEEHYYIAMEYVSGRDLRFMLDAAKKRKKLLPLPLSVFVAHAVCEGLDYAHRKKDAQGKDMNIVHRDVSPQNVLVSYDGDVKVIDFGIAKAQNRSQKTQAGILKGKFGYMSPEQVRGLPIDRRSDIFALGVILYEMLTGERLFVGESDFSTLEKVRNAEVLPPREFNDAIPEALEAIVLKSLAREAEARYQWAAEMGEDLMRFLLQGNAIFGQKQLGQYMKAEFTPELDRENERLARFASIEGPDGTPAVPLPGPATQPGGPPAPSQIRASKTLQDMEAIPADPRAEEPQPSPEKTQLFDPAFTPPSPMPIPRPPDEVGLRSAATQTMEIPAVEEGAPTLLDMPSVGPTAEGKTVIRAESSGPRSAQAVHERASSRAPPAVEGKTVIKAEPSHPRADIAVSRADLGVPAVAVRSEALPSRSGSALPPAVRLVPVTEVETAGGRPRWLSPTVIALIGGVAAGVLLLSLLVLWLRGPSVPPGTLVISPSPAAGVALSVDGRPIPEGEHHTFVARGLVPGDHVVEARNQYGLRVLKVAVQPGATQPVEIGAAEGPPVVAPVPAPTGPTGVAAAPPVPGPGVAAATGTATPVVSPKLGLDLSSPGSPKAEPIQIVLQTDPPDAELLVDHESVGRAPYTLTSTDPQHLFRLKAVGTGHLVAEKNARFTESQTVTLVLHEERSAAGPSGGRHHSHFGPPGTLAISSRPVAKVFIDGRSTDRYTPVPPGAPLEIPSGDHLIHLESDDGKKADREVSIQPHTLTKLVGVTLN
ncbi:MAG TPA: protein kinase [Myxococcales bacterium]|nr:protein kinase [Myxococcales bacterium]